MFDIQNYGSFILAILAFQLAPGAGTIAILNATARNGTAAGMAAVIGTLCGDFLFMVAAVAGLAAVLKANPLLLQLLQWFGAAYLCWIGITLLCSKGETVREADRQRLSALSHFRRAFAVSITNPKVVLFFFSFFPLFLRPNASPATLAAIMAHVTVLSLAYQTVLVFVGNSVARRLQALPSARKVAVRLAGLAFLALGVRLAANNR